MIMQRLRRLKKSKAVRDLVSQTQLHASNFIMPYFVIEGEGKIEEINSLPGVYRYSIDTLVQEVKEIRKLGVKAILLFGVGATKYTQGREAYNSNGIVQRAIRVLKSAVEDVAILSDVCLCGYTSHGHCGILKDKKIDNDASIKVLSKVALSHAKAGADFVAPSAMMDRQVKAIRQTLDRNGYKDVGILAYSAKYASSFYGPFREALDSAPQFGDRKTYQMDYRNSDQALQEIKQDIDEGADLVMVKPALAYLDIIYRTKERFDIPLVAYSVSGEYTLIKKLSADNKDLEKSFALEIISSIKRAGADLIITYYAKRIAQWLKT